MENGENWLRNCSIFKSIEKKKLIENGLRVWRKGHEEDDRTSFHTSQMDVHKLIISLMIFFLTSNSLTIIIWKWF